MPGMDYVHVCLDEDGHPVRAYHESEYQRARDAVNSDSYRDEDIVDLRLDVPLYEVDDGE